MEEKRLSLRDAGGFKSFGGNPSNATVKGNQKETKSASELGLRVRNDG